jgi:glycine/D-amino acid oxidase-like deaminating enzyme
METAYDVVVVGGGAAGLSAALVLGRARRRVAVVDAGATRNAPAAHMQGYLSRDGMGVRPCVERYGRTPGAAHSQLDRTNIRRSGAGSVRAVPT